MKIFSIHLITLMVLVSSPQFGFSQDDNDKNFIVGINGGSFLAGDYDLTYDTTIGAELQYVFSHKSKFHHFVNTGFATDLGVDGANLFAFNAGIGTRYNLLSIWQKPLSTSLNAGGLYMHERFSNQVIGNVIEVTDTNFSFFVKFGISYPIFKRFDFQLNATQYGTKGTAAGAGILFSF